MESVSQSEYELVGQILLNQVEVFWAVTPCSVAVEYRRFEGLKT